MLDKKKYRIFLGNIDFFKEFVSFSNKPDN